MLCGREGIDDDQPAAAAWAWQREDAGGRIGILDRVIVSKTRNRCFGPEQLPDPRDIGGPIAVAEEAIVADAVLAFGQDVDEEPADELVGFQGHGGVPPGAGDAVVLDAEGDAPVVDPYQAAVGDRDTVGVARQVCQHGFGSGEGLLGIHDPIDLA